VPSRFPWSFVTKGPPEEAQLFQYRNRGERIVPLPARHLTTVFEPARASARRLERQRYLCRRILTGPGRGTRRVESQRYIRGRDTAVAGSRRRKLTADNADGADKAENEAVGIFFSYPRYPRYPRFYFWLRRPFRGSGWGWSDSRRLESQRYLEGRAAAVAGFGRREVAADNAEGADKEGNGQSEIGLLIRVIRAIRGSSSGSGDSSVETGGDAGILADWKGSVICTAGF